MNHKAMLVAGNYAQARLAMDNIDEPVDVISEGQAINMRGREPHTPVYMYGTYEDRDDLGDILDEIMASRYTTRNVLIRDGYWRGRL